MRSQNGFTLLELIATITIICIMILMIIPNLFHLVDSLVLESAQAKLAQDIRLVKMHAIATERNISVIFPYAGADNAYIINCPQRGNVEVKLPEGIEFSTVRGGQGTFSPRIVFSPDGTPWGGATIGLANRKGESRYVIVAAVSGRVRKDRVPPD